MAEPMRRSLEYSANLKAPSKNESRRGEVSNSRLRSKQAKVTKAVSVGGGAKISQELVADTLEIADWHQQESAVIRLYFVFEQQFRDMVDKGGIKDIEGSSDGYLNGLPTG